MENKETAPTGAPTPTQVKYNWRATLRTGVQAAVPTLITAGSILFLFAESFEGLPPQVTATVLSFAGFTITCSMFLTKIMAIPTVDSLLTKFGLSAVPKQAQDSLESFFERYPDAEAQKLPVREVTHEDGVG